MLDVVAWGDVSTWLAGLGTTAAVAVSLRQVYQERTARQADERRRRELDERSQAALVAAWLGGPEEREYGESAPDYVSVLNGSLVPVYDAVATLVFVQGGGPRRGEDDRPLFDGRAVFAVVPPGRWYFAMPYSGWRGVSAHPGIEIGFRDAHGQSWIRRATGDLVKIDQNPIDYYRYPRPVGYQDLTPLP